MQPARCRLPPPRARHAPAPAVGAQRAALLVAVALTCGGCLVKVETPNLAGQDVRLTLIHTSDLHSRLFPYQFAPGAIDRGLGLVPTKGNIAVVGGMARMATAIKRERAASQRVLHLDSGDIMQGAPVYNTFAGEVEMRAMTRVGLNAMALGNHEFDKGPVTLELMKNRFGGFPILAANYMFTDPNDPTQPKLRLVIAPFAIFNVQGLRVGVIGMGNLSSLQGIIEGGNSLGIRPLEPTDAVKNAVALIRGSVDLVIMVSHLGLDEDEGVAQTTNVQDENPVIDGVDVILGGHLHIVLNPPKDLPRVDENGNPTGHTVLCHSGAFGKYIGRLDLSVHVADPAVPGDRNAVRSYTYKVIPIDDSIPEDPDMANMLEPYQLKMNRVLNLIHDYAIVPCPKDAATCPKVIRSDPDGGDSQLGNLVAASMRLRPRVEADFGLTNSLGIRADFESGPLDLEQMFNVFPFDNTITTMFLSGKEIAEMLDFVAARSADRGCKTQSQVSGIWMVLDCAHKVACGPFAPDGKPTARCYHGEPGYDTPGYAGPRDGPFLLGDNCLQNPARCTPVLPSAEYRAAVNDYIASGGSGFSMLKRNTTKFNTGISLRDSLIDYIVQQNGRCDPLDYQNVAQVSCADPLGGADVDCTADCCHDPGKGTACDAGSEAFKACASRKARLVYDVSNLPCLDGRVQPHDGRITTIKGG